MKTIDKDNIEVWLYDYAENLLDDKTRDEFEAFLELHPEYKQLLQEYNTNLMLPKTNIVFDGKEELLKLTQKQKRVVFVNKKQKFFSAKRVRIYAVCLCAIMVFACVVRLGFVDEDSKIDKIKMAKNKVNTVNNKVDTVVSKTLAENIFKSDDNNKPPIIPYEQKEQLTANTNAEIENTSEAIENQVNEQTMQLALNNEVIANENKALEEKENTTQVYQEQDTTIIYVVVSTYEQNEKNGILEQIDMVRSKLTDKYTTLTDKVSLSGNAIVQVTNDIKQKIKSNKIIKF